jgi:hypothetical protein
MRALDEDEDNNENQDYKHTYKLAKEQDNSQV